MACNMTNEELAVKYQKSAGEERKEYGDLLCRNNTGLIKLICRRHFKLPDIDMEDALQCGYIGLLIAADHFNADMGYKFTTYAAKWIRREIDSVYISGVSCLGLSNGIRSSIHAVRRGCANEKNVKQIAKNTGLSETNINLLSNAMSDPVYLDALINDETDINYSNNIPSPETDFLKNTVNAEINNTMKDILKSSFTDMDCNIIEDTFGLNGIDYTNDELARKYNITKYKLKILERKAIRCFRQPKNIAKLKI